MNKKHRRSLKRHGLASHIGASIHSMRSVSFEQLEARIALSATPPTATMLGQGFQLPTWLSAGEIEAAQMAASAVTTSNSSLAVHQSTLQSYSNIGMYAYNANPAYSQFDGSNTSIVIIDSGADLDHPVP